MRSCEACIKAKTRCDNTRPSCARCIARHIPCTYSKGIVRPKGSDDISLHQTSHLDDVEVIGLPDASSTTPSSNEAAEPIEANVDLLDFSFASSGFGLPDWGLPHSNFSSTNKWGPFVPLPQLGHRDRRIDLIPMADQSEGHPIPRMPTYHLRSFAQSKSITGRTSPSATLMTHMLTSFPRMMYNPGSLPPFIHPYSLGHNAHNPNEGFESLNTCVTLMQMVSGGAIGGRKLFWRNIVACALNEQVNFGLCIARSGLYYGFDRHEWIFEESRRRLALVYQILKMLYSLDPATSCAEPDGFLLAPLPGRKQLWEAPDAQAWMAEKSRDGILPSVFGVLTGGQMVRLQEQQVIMPDEINFPLGIGDEESAGNWQEWCAGMDGLGALVTLAVSLTAT